MAKPQPSTRIVALAGTHTSAYETSTNELFGISVAPVGQRPSSSAPFAREHSRPLPSGRYTLRGGGMNTVARYFVLGLCPSHTSFNGFGSAPSAYGPSAALLPAT